MFPRVIFYCSLRHDWCHALDALLLAPRYTQSLYFHSLRRVPFISNNDRSLCPRLRILASVLCNCDISLTISQVRMESPRPRTHTPVVHLTIPFRVKTFTNALLGLPRRHWISPSFQRRLTCLVLHDVGIPIRLTPTRPPTYCQSHTLLYLDSCTYSAFFIVSQTPRFSLPPTVIVSG